MPQFTMQKSDGSGKPYSVSAFDRDEADSFALEDNARVLYSGNVQTNSRGQGMVAPNPTSVFGGQGGPKSFTPATSSFMRENQALQDKFQQYQADTGNQWSPQGQERERANLLADQTARGYGGQTGPTSPFNDEQMYQQGFQRSTGAGTRLNPNKDGVQGIGGFDPSSVIGEQIGQGGVVPAPRSNYIPGRSGGEGADNDIERLIAMYEGMAGNPEVQGLIAGLIADMQMQQRGQEGQMEQLNPFDLTQQQFLQEEEARRYSDSGEGVAKEQRMAREAEFAAMTAQRGIETGAETTQRQAEFDRDAMIRQIEQTERSRGDMEQTVRQRQEFDAQTAQQQQGFESQQVQQQQGFEAQTEQQGQSLDAQTQQQQQQFDNQQIQAKDQLDADYNKFSDELGLEKETRSQDFERWELEFDAAGLQRTADIAQEMSALNAEFENQQALFGTSSSAETQQRQASLDNQLASLREQYAQQKSDSAIAFEEFELTQGSESAIQLARIEADKAARVAEAAAMATARSAEAAAAGNPFGLNAEQWMAEQDKNRTAAAGGLTQQQAPQMIQAILGMLNPEVLGSIGYLSGQQQLPAVPTISSLRQAPESQMNFLQGLFGAAGIEPSMLMNLIKSVTPQGGAATGSTLA